jgi:predicted phosphodiesterase
MTKIFAATLVAVATATLQIGVISDVHMNQAYNAYNSGAKCTTAGTSGEIVAPIDRYGCDGSPELIDLLFTRFAEAFGSVDVIIVPGDSAAHKVAESVAGEDPSGAKYAAVKANLQATFNKFNEHFPNTVILPTFGNNDGRVHDEAIDEADKSDYYNFVYNLWFEQLTGNAGLDVASIKKTLLSAGYYRADISPKVTLLSLNSMYMDAADLSTHGGEAETILSWLQYQLTLAQQDGRKVIISDHVYAGTRFQAE